MADQHVDAYFKSEDDAQDVQTKLEVAGAKDYTIEEIPKDEDELTIPAFAFAGTGAGTTAGSGVGAGGTGGSTGVAGMVGAGLPAFFGFADEEDDIAERNILCSFVIDDQKYEEALHMIREAGGKVYD
jgi:hypothetical protein